MEDILGVFGYYTYEKKQVYHDRRKNRLMRISEFSLLLSARKIYEMTKNKKRRCSFSTCDESGKSYSVEIKMVTS